MKYYKSIEMNDFDQIKKTTLEYAIEQNYSKKSGFRAIKWSDYRSYCPQILTAFSMYDLIPVNGFFIVTNVIGPLHMDYKSSRAPVCRINVPILNCEGTLTEFYTGGQYLPKTKTGNFSYLIIDDFSMATKIAEVEVLKPTVLRIQEPHRVVPNLKTTPRITLSLIMNKDPVFLLDQ
jgi:hypothetical protein